MSTVSTTVAPGTDITVTFALPGRACFSGSRAQLEAEGVIPAGLEWPERTAAVYWMVGEVHFGLRRARPEGVKGPMAVWINGDHWCLSQELHGGALAKYYEQRRKKARLDRLASDLRPLSPAGRLEIARYEKRVLTAQGDKAFQAFKALILPKRPRRGSPPKVRAD